MNWSIINKILNVLFIIIVVGYAIKYFYQQPKFESGEKAQDFTAVLRSGEKFTFSDLRGRYVLIDFWGSWCGPCRKENPELKSLYTEMKNMTFVNAGGFEIVSIAIESKRENWENAILKDGLDWPYHIGEFENFSDPIAILFGVKKLPTKYFVNPEGMIIMVNPGINEIRSYLLDKAQK